MAADANARTATTMAIPASVLICRRVVPTFGPPYNRRRSRHGDSRHARWTRHSDARSEGAGDPSDSGEPRGPAAGRLAETRQDLALVEVEEALLIGADLVYVDMRVAGVLEALDHLHVPVHIRAAGDALLDVLRADHARRLREVAGHRQLL